jgi:hypothetical protein
MSNRRRRNTPQAEGEHGLTTESQIKRQLRSGSPELSASERVEQQRKKAAFEGKRRLVEDRQQHDEGEKNSERTRLFAEVRRGRNDGPSDNTNNLHGVLGSREHRADYKERGPDGLPRNRRP